MKRRYFHPLSLLRNVRYQYNIPSPPPSLPPPARRTHTTSTPSLGMRKNDARIHMPTYVQSIIELCTPHFSISSGSPVDQSARGGDIHKTLVMHPGVYKMRYSRSCNAIHQTVYKSKLIKNFCVYDITCDITPRVSSVYYIGARN